MQNIVATEQVLSHKKAERSAKLSLHRRYIAGTRENVDPDLYMRTSAGKMEWLSPKSSIGMICMQLL